jgi:hypothetical protein
MEHFGETRTQYRARNRAQGATPTRRPGCGGQLDQVTGIGSPAQRLVELEVRLGLGDRIGQRERLNPAGSRMSAPGRLLPAHRSRLWTAVSHKQSHEGLDSGLLKPPATTSTRAPRMWHPSPHQRREFGTSSARNSRNRMIFLYFQRVILQNVTGRFGIGSVWATRTLGLRKNC